MHKNQYRKASATPYASHPVSVGFILHSAGYSEDVVIAGILHDILEDTEGTEIEMEKLFGAKVLNMVKGVTEEKIPSWEEKKKRYLEHIAEGDEHAKAISAADLLDNSRSTLRLLKNNIDIWGAFTESPETILEFYKKRVAIIKKSIDNELTTELESTITELEKLK